MLGTRYSIPAFIEKFCNNKEFKIESPEASDEGREPSAEPLSILEMICQQKGVVL
jgi:hypothetical protein